MAENILYRIRREARECGNVRADLSLDIYDNAGGVIVKSWGSVKAVARFKTYTGDIDIDKVRISLKDTREKARGGKKFNPKAWYRTGGSIYRVTKALSTFLSSEEDEIFNLEAFDEVKGGGPPYEFKLSKKGASAIEGYRDSSMTVEEMEKRCYRFYLTVETYMDGSTYINKFQWILKIA